MGFRTPKRQQIELAIGTLAADYIAALAYKYAPESWRPIMPHAVKVGLGAFGGIIPGKAGNIISDGAYLKEVQDLLNQFVKPLIPLSPQRLGSYERTAMAPTAVVAATGAYY